MLNGAKTALSGSYAVIFVKSDTAGGVKAVSCKASGGDINVRITRDNGQPTQDLYIESGDEMPAFGGSGQITKVEAKYAASAGSIILNALMV